MFGLSTAKLIGAGVGILGVIAFVLLAFHWRNTMRERGEKLATICAATRLAADNPKLGCGEVPTQIGELGKSVATLKAALAKQNAAIVAQAQESARQQAEAKQASEKAEKRAQAAEGVAARLEASLRAGGHPAGSGGPICDASDAVKEQWP